VSENRVLESVFGSSSEVITRVCRKLMTMSFIIWQKCFDTLSISYRVMIGPYHRSFANIRECSLLFGDFSTVLCFNYSQKRTLK